MKLASAEVIWTFPQTNGTRWLILINKVILWWRCHGPAARVVKGNTWSRLVCFSGEKEQERNREMRTEVWCSFQRSLMLSQIPAGGLDKNMRGSPTFETLLRVTQSNRL